MYKKAFWISLILLGCFFLNGCGGVPAAEQSSDGDLIAKKAVERIDVAQEFRAGIHYFKNI